MVILFYSVTNFLQIGNEPLHENQSLNSKLQIIVVLKILLIIPH